MTPYISLAIWVPIFAGVAVLMLGGERDAMKARWTALAGALAGFLVTIPLYTHFDLTTSAMQCSPRQRPKHCDSPYNAWCTLSITVNRRMGTQEMLKRL